MARGRVFDDSIIEFRYNSFQFRSNFESQLLLFIFNNGSNRNIVWGVSVNCSNKFWTIFILRYFTPWIPWITFTNPILNLINKTCVYSGLIWIVWIILSNVQMEFSGIFFGVYIPQKLRSNLLRFKIPNPSNSMEEFSHIWL